MLGQITDLAWHAALIQHHLSTGGLQLTAENLHESRLATAIGADQAVAVAVVEFDGDIFKQRLA